jgi:anaerobic magnesium-protoporphyrin IX monomethyl ester cyclase
MRPLNILLLQLGNHHSRRDSSELTHRGFRTRDSMSWAYVSYEPGTYSDGLYYVGSFLMEHLPEARFDVCQMMWGDDPADYPIESYDYILVSGLGTHFWSNLAAMRLVKKRKRPGACSIMGGPHATFAPYEALEYVDFVILGEGEVPALKLIETLESGGSVEDVDNLGYVDSDGLLAMTEMRRYGNLGVAINPALLTNAPFLPWAPVSMSRGCPFNCSFCYAVRLLGRQFRTKDVSGIRAEVDALHQRNGCRRFLVTDLNFATQKDFCHEVARAFRGGPYKFIALTRVSIADDEDLVEDLKAAGFEDYYFGVESEDPEVLKGFNKNIEAGEQTDRLLKMAEHDIFIHAGLIFGTDAQDQMAVERTARWCAEARIIHPNFYCITDYPFQNILHGSHQDVEDHRIIMGHSNYQHFSFVGIFPRHMRPSDLQRTLAKCSDEFFVRALEIERRPKRIVRLRAVERLKAAERVEVERHTAFLEQLEAPYYTAAGELKEDLLKRDFDAKYGHISDWLERSRKRRRAESPHASLAMMPA